MRAHSRSVHHLSGSFPISGLEAESDLSHTEHFIASVAVLLSTVGNVDTAVGRLHLANGQGAVMVVATDVQGLTGVRHTSLDGARGHTAVCCGQPFELRLGLSYEDLVVSMSVLLTTPGDVATGVTRDNLARDNVVTMSCATDVEGFTTAVSTTVYCLWMNVRSVSRYPVAQGSVGGGSAVSHCRLVGWVGSQ